MQAVFSLLISSILAIWVAAIAILAVQNATPISLSFLSFTSIQIPLGVALSFCSAVGILGGALTYPLKRTNRDRN